jgi:Mor family transcriptional regulator
MTAGDIINWPQEVEFKALDALNTEELKKIHEVAKEDQLDFSPEFIRWFKASSEKDELRSDVSKYLGDKLAIKLNVPSIKRLPWSEMTAGDIINWPQEVKFQRINFMNKKELKKLYRLAKEDLLDFSPEFLYRSKTKKKGVHKLRSEMTNYLSKKLAQKIGTPRFYLPWSKMTAKDIINWPQEVEFNKFDKIKSKELKRLHELAKQDLLDFSPEFISRFTAKEKGLLKDMY